MSLQDILKITGSSNDRVSTCYNLWICLWFWLPSWGDGLFGSFFKMVAMATASAEMSAHGHLHLDPTLEIEVPVEAKCNTCCPIKAIFRKIFCCCSSNCCNETTVHRDVVIYCDSDGTCKEFDPSKSKNPEEDYKKTADRVRSLVEVEKLKRGSQIRQETGIDLEGKSARGEPIRLRELRRLQSI